MALVVKNLPANAGDVKDAGSIPGSERSPGEGHGNPLQYSCLENPMEEKPGMLQATGLKKIRQDWACTHTHTHTQSPYMKKEMKKHEDIGAKLFF